MQLFQASFSSLPPSNSSLKPVPQTRPSSSSLKPVPQTCPSNSSLKPVPPTRPSNSSLKLLTLTLTLLFSSLLSAQSWYDKKWEEVYQYERDGLSKSAYTLSERIFERASKKEDTYQLVKAYIYWSKYKLTLFENTDVAVLQRLQQEIARAEVPQKNLLQSVYAGMLYQYLDENEFKLRKRTPVADSIAKDPSQYRSWDIMTLVQEINTYFERSLKPAERLQAIGVTEAADLLRGGEAPSPYRPTLYDLLAHQAVEFYKERWSGIQVKIDTLNRNSPALLGIPEEFQKLEFIKEDTVMSVGKEFDTYQKLERVHISRADTTALADVFLLRLKAARKNSLYKQKDSLYFSTLEQAVEHYEDHPASAMIAYTLADELYDATVGFWVRQDPATRQYRIRALELVRWVLDRYPNTDGGVLAKLLEPRIAKSTLTLTSDGPVPPGKPILSKATFKAVDSLYVHIYALDHRNQLQAEIRKRDSVTIQFIMSHEPLISRFYLLQPRPDYFEHTTEIDLPALPPGHYLLAATDTADPGPRDLFGYQNIQVSAIAVLTMNTPDQLEYRVVDRDTGHPMADVNYLAYDGEREYRSGKTDDRGRIRFIKPDGHRQDIQLRIMAPGDTLVSGREYIKKRRKKEKEELFVKATVLLDRAIYRPGQTLYYKGILTQSRGMNTKVVPGVYTGIYIADANGDEIHYARVKTNEFGSVSGSYTLPQGLLTGVFSIRMEEDDNAEGEDDPFWEDVDDLRQTRLRFSVEEYKRPRFAVSIAAPEENYALGDTLEFEGLAKSFMGAAIDRGRVNYTVTRRTEPLFYWDHMAANTTVITTDTTTTEVDGTFTIRFPALPDEDAHQRLHPVFVYILEAEVTDISGETRTATRQYRMGYQNLKAQLQAEETLKPDEQVRLSITTTDLNGLPAAASVNLEVVALNAPDRVLRPKSWDPVDWHYLDKETYVKLFPHEVYDASELKTHWPEGEKQYTFKGEVNDSLGLLLPETSDWKAGTYRVKLFMESPAGDTLSLKHDFDLLPTDEHTLEQPTYLSWEVSNEKKVKEEGKARIALRTSLEHLPVHLYAHNQGKVIYDEVLYLDPGTTKVEIPVSDELSREIEIRVLSVWNNSVFNGYAQVHLPVLNPGLELETLSFRDKMLPDAGETWSFKVTDESGQAAKAEFLASMYDYSLEAFRMHRWDTRLAWVSSPYLGSVLLEVDGLNRSWFKPLNRGAYTRVIKKLKNYPTLQWFGLDFGDPVSGVRRYTPPLDLGKKATGNISGIVTDADGLPLPGAAIVVEDAREAAQTDFDGFFTLNARRGDVLIVSYLGFKTIQVAVTEVPAVFNISLEGEVQMLEEVVRVAHDTEVEVESEVALAYEIQEDKVGGAAADKDDVISVRENLEETAFFMPHLTTDSKGLLEISFTAPQALTQWRLMLLGHTKTVKKGYLEKFAVTQKELSVLPNLPRFMRAGDTLTITARLQNLTNNAMYAKAQLELLDAGTGKSVAMLRDEGTKTRSVQLPANGGGVVRWTLVVPQNLQGVEYTITARAGSHTDGEGGMIPVLENRRLITESRALWVLPGKEATVEFENMNTPSETRKDHAFTLEYTANPTWTAIRSLPYLMEFPYECAEQTFARYYANALGEYVLRENPQVKQVFDAWQENADKTDPEAEARRKALLEASPWLGDLESDEQQRAHLSKLFDESSMEVMLNNSLQKLRQLQMPSGGFPWFSGGRGNFFITRHILAGFGHLKALQQRQDWKNEERRIIEKALGWTDAKTLEYYKKMKEDGGELRMTTAGHHYLYMRAFYKDDFPPGDDLAQLIEELLDLSRDQWLKEGLYVQGLMINYLQSWGKKEDALKMIAALKEQSVLESEYGRYWKANRSGWYWYNSPIETQALMIEGFAKAGESTEVLDGMKMWLLRQKQTKNWPTTKATTEAVYALMMQGSNWLSVKDNTVITLGKETIRTAKLKETEKEAGTGYINLKWNSEEMTPEMAEVTVKNKGEVAGYGGVYWQYFEAADKVKASGTKDLSVSKQVFLRRETTTGSRLFRVKETDPIRVGDLLTVRLEITAGADLEFLHLEDMRASGLEPVDVLSAYKWQDGVGYYQSTRDLATHFFFDEMPEGVYVIEYQVRANHAGAFTNGFTTLKSMYAPEFSAQSKGERIKIAE